MSAEDSKATDFYRKKRLRRPDSSDLLTLEDADEYKLSAMDQLIKEIMLFHLELNSFGFNLKPDKNDQHLSPNLYEMADIGYAGCVEIAIKSDWFNTKWGSSLDNDFNFELFVMQKGKYEIADWIYIRVCYLKTVPMALASLREYAKALGFLLDPKDYFFHDLSISYEDRIIDGKLTFKTAAFEVAVEDACKIMEKIISRKEYLRVLKRKP